MRHLEFGQEASLAQILESIKAVPEKELSLVIAKEALVLKNPANLKIIQKSAASLGKVIHFPPESNPPSDKENIPEFMEGQDVMEHLNSPSFRGESSLEPALFSSPAEAGNAREPVKEKKKRSLFPKLTVKKKGPLIIGLLLFILLGGAFAAYWYIPKATIALYVSPEPFDKEATLSASLRAGAVDVENKVLPLVSLESVETDSLSAKATGKKTVGEHARGRVTVRNYNTVSQKSFEKGTVIKVAQGVEEGAKFTFDRTIVVPAATQSASKDPLTGRNTLITDPGKAEVEVTAVAIGESGNIAAGTQFSVGDQSLLNVEAFNATDFSGGSSKEVTVVSSEDRKNLSESLTKKLAEKASGNLKSKLKDGQVLLEKTAKETVLKETFNKDIDAQAEELTLKLELAVSAKAYAKEDLKKMMTSSLENDVPKGYEVSTDKYELTAETLRVTEDGEVVLLGRLEGMLVPKLAAGEVAANLRGKPLKEAASYLNSLGNITDYQIRLWPTLPEPFNNLPYLESKIQIEIVPK
jgi:hypothetical protein